MKMSKRSIKNELHFSTFNKKKKKTKQQSNNNKKTNKKRGSKEKSFD